MSLFDKVIAGFTGPMSDLDALRAVRDAALRDWLAMSETPGHEKMAAHLSKAIDVVHQMIKDAAGQSLNKE